jgi:hypothetical protein
MSWRFRRSVRIAKGVRLNFNKSGVGVSVGGKGFHTGIGPRGMTYKALGQKRKAINQLNKVYAVDMDYTDVKEQLEELNPAATLQQQATETTTDEQGD